MKERQNPAADEFDWPEQEPGYGMPCLRDPESRSAPPAAPPAAPAAEPRSSAQASTAPAGPPAFGALAESPLPFPCAHRLDHFPAMFARTGLFGARRQPRTKPQLLERVVVKGQQHYDGIVFEGRRLTMKDKEVYEAVVRIAKAAKLDLNEPLRTSLRDIAEKISVTEGGAPLDWIYQALSRLADARVEFRLADKAPRGGKLLARVSKSPIGVEVAFDPAFALPAFGGDQQFRIDIARRERLGSALARWLHDFLSTHKAGVPLSLPYLQELCGMSCAPKSFCRALRTASEELVTEAPELVASFKLDDFRRSSELWTIEFERGAESCDFFRPIDFASLAPKSAKERGAAL